MVVFRSKTTTHFQCLVSSGLVVTHTQCPIYLSSVFNTCVSSIDLCMFSRASSSLYCQGLSIVLQFWRITQSCSIFSGGSMTCYSTCWKISVQLEHQTTLILRIFWKNTCTNEKTKHHNKMLLCGC